MSWRYKITYADGHEEWLDNIVSMRPKGCLESPPKEQGPLPEGSAVLVALKDDGKPLTDRAGYVMFRHVLGTIVLAEKDD